MKAYNAVYKYGHLYNIDTGTRILLEGNSKFSVTVNPEDVLAQDPYNKEITGRSTEALIDKLKRSKYTEATKVLPAGACVYFDINAGSKGKKTEWISCSFQVKLLEDLFIARKVKGTKYNIMECNCVADQCLTRNLEFFEPIYAYSLNNVYMKTYDFYFRLFGSPTVNAKDEFRDSIDRKPGFLSLLCVPSNQPELIL